MVKSYLRFRGEESVGIIVSGDCQAVLDPSGRLAISPALENVVVWNVKQGIMVRTLKHPVDQSVLSPEAGGKVTSLQLHPDASSCLVAVGHSDGSIRIWNYEQGLLKVTLKGHRTAVSALAFNDDGSRLASGARDTDLVLWDVIAETGLFRLKGHTGEITHCAFVGNDDYLLSSSKDSLMKLWDLKQQHCTQTLVGHRLEIWGFCVDPSQSRIVSGGSDEELRVWSVNQKEDDVEIVLEGTLSKQSKGRVQSLSFDSRGKLLFVCCKGKQLDYFRIRSEKEVDKKLNRKLKRKKEKGQEPELSADNFLEAQFELQTPITFEGKLKGFSVGKCPGDEKRCRILISSDCNTLEVHDGDKNGFECKHSLESYGHRTGVRSVSISTDDSCILSLGGKECRIWNSHTMKCIRSISTGVAICGMFLPGNKHCLVGTKSGDIELYHIPSGALLQRLRAHSGSVWSLDLHPKGTGFVSGAADQDVKFWHFEFVSEDSSKKLQFVHTRTLKMEDDVLCVKYSPDSTSVAVSTLDSQVRLFHADTLNFKLSFYGHTLPVVTFDISSDSSLLVTGSADKTIKIWGMDFGDCHRSFIAHSDSVMKVQFIPQTHYFLSCGKDREIHHWDADKLVKIQTLHGNQSEVWGLAIDSSGSFFVTSENQRSIRLWRESDSQVFLEEEQSQELERNMEHDAVRDADDLANLEHTSSRILNSASGSPLGIESEIAAKNTIQTMKASERLSEMINIASMELQKPVKEQKKNPILMGMDVDNFLLKALKQIHPSELQLALIVLPYEQATWLLKILQKFLTKGLEIELCVRCVLYLSQAHYHQLMVTEPNTHILDGMREVSKKRLGEQKDRIGFNKAALSLLKGELDTTTHFYEDSEPSHKKIKV